MRHIPCILMTVGITLVAEVAAASLLVLLDYLLLPSGTLYPWGAAVGETTGNMMLPAIMLCVFALSRRTTVFAGLALFCCPGFAYLVYLGHIADHAPAGEATFGAISMLVGSAVAIPVIVLRMRGRWKY